MFTTLRGDEDLKPSYCFGLEISEFDTVNNKYNISFIMQRNTVPDTNLPAYEPSLKIPNDKAITNFIDSGF